MHKAKCILDSNESGLMFIMNEIYSVEKQKSTTMNKYVVVHGKFTNWRKEKFNAERILSKELCQKHLKIV